LAHGLIELETDEGLFNQLCVLLELDLALCLQRGTIRAHDGLAVRVGIDSVARAPYDLIEEGEVSFRGSELRRGAEKKREGPATPEIVCLGEIEEEVLAGRCGKVPGEREVEGLGEWSRHYAIG